MPVPRLLPGRTGLLLVDMQERLLPHIHAAEALTGQVGRLLDGANALGVPVLVTEQYRRGLGATVPALDARLAAAACRHEKLAFSACIPAVRTEIARRGLAAAIVCGIEAHVCVLQTCLDLLDAGLIVAVAADAVGSRRPADRDAALARLVQAGVVPTTVESALLELVREAGTPQFKAVLPVIR